MPALYAYEEEVVRGNVVQAYAVVDARHTPAVGERALRRLARLFGGAFTGERGTAYDGRDGGVRRDVDFRFPDVRSARAFKAALRRYGDGEVDYHRRLLVLGELMPMPTLNEIRRRRRRDDG